MTEFSPPAVFHREMQDLIDEFYESTKHEPNTPRSERKRAFVVFVERKMGDETN